MLRVHLNSGVIIEADAFFGDSEGWQLKKNKSDKPFAFVPYGSINFVELNI